MHVPTELTESSGGTITDAVAGAATVVRQCLCLVCVPLLCGEGTAFP